MSKQTIRFLPLVASFGVFLAGCQPMGPPGPELGPAELSRTMEDDGKVLAQMASHDAELRRSFVDLERTGDWRKRGYFTAQESDRTELLWFRFHTSHQHLNRISERYDGMKGNREAAEVQAQSRRQAHRQARFMVDTFGKDPVAVEKLNQAYPRSHIPRDSYDQLAESLEAAVKRREEHLKDRLEEEWDDVEFALQSALFYRVSRLKKPGAKLVSFTAAQKSDVVSRLQPGDLLLTYTAGYASDVFIPGAFKHGLTFVGTVDQRRAAGLAVGHGVTRRNLEQAVTRGGRPADVIEAVAEGVKFSNLGNLMDTHVNRLLAIRPVLSAGDRTTQLERTFSYHGQDYDFRFDFADASRQVCTEVIYRALNGLNGFDFPLTRRGGHVTLSADDLVNYWLEQKPDGFELVFLAGEAPGLPGHRARILTGDAGKKRLEQLMAGENGD